jgi:hypothetical protein
MAFSTVAPFADDVAKSTTSDTDNEDDDDDDNNHDDDDLPDDDHDQHEDDPEQQNQSSSCSRISRILPTRSDETTLSGSVTVMAGNRTTRRRWFPFSNSRTIAARRACSRKAIGEGGDGGGGGDPSPLLLATGVLLLLSSTVSVGLLVYSVFDPASITNESSNSTFVDPDSFRFRGYILDRPTASPSSFQEQQLTNLTNMTTVAPSPTFMPSKATIKSNKKSSQNGHFSLTGGRKPNVGTTKPPNIAPNDGRKKSNSTSLKITSDANPTIMPSASSALRNKEPALSAGTEKSKPQSTISPKRQDTLMPTMVADPTKSSPKKLPKATRPTSSAASMPFATQNEETRIKRPKCSPTLKPSIHKGVEMTTDVANQPTSATTSTTWSTTGVVTAVHASSSSTSLAPTSEPSLDPTFNMQTISPLPTVGVPSGNASLAAVMKRADCPDLPNVPPLPGKKGIGMTLRPEGSKGSWVEHLPKIIELNPYWNHCW